MTMEKLNEIFALQKSFQESLGYDFDAMKHEERVEYIKWNTLAMIDEIMEGLRETPWKPWKKQQTFEYTKIKEELVDLLHFFVNGCLIVNMSAEELFLRYRKKMKVNKERQIEGY